MPVVVRKNTLTGLLVKEAFRKQVVRLHREASIEHAINQMSKHKINTILVMNDEMHPAGVVSKTDIMGAYYASLPIESPLDYIMSSPPQFCQPDDLLERALEKMRSHKIHGLYVLGETAEETTGILTYSDIVGLLYQYCHKCKFSKLRVVGKKQNQIPLERFKAKDVMSSQVVSLGEDNSLNDIMEALSAYSFGAVLITDENNLPCGVISKTDLVLSCKRQIPQDAPAKTIMSMHVPLCEENECLEIAIEKMILSEVQQLFVFKETPKNISGVLTLSDAARLRSGSCYACMTSRIRVEKL